MGSCSFSYIMRTAVFLGWFFTVPASAFHAWKQQPVKDPQLIEIDIATSTSVFMSIYTYIPTTL